MTSLTAPSFTKGFAICAPDGEIIGHSYRPTPDEAIAFRLPRHAGRAERWQKLVAKGWSVRPVYARVWEPLFFTTCSYQPDIEEENDE